MHGHVVPRRQIEASPSSLRSVEMELAACKNKSIFRCNIIIIILLSLLLFHYFLQSSFLLMKQVQNVASNWNNSLIPNMLQTNMLHCHSLMFITFWFKAHRHHQYYYRHDNYYVDSVKVIKIIKYGLRTCCGQANDGCRWNNALCRNACKPVRSKLKGQLFRAKLGLSCH